MEDLKKRSDRVTETLSQPVRRLIAYTMSPSKPYTQNERDAMAYLGGFLPGIGIVQPD